MLAKLNAVLKGWRTIIIGLVIACAPSAITYLASVDWTQYVGPNAALFVSGLIAVAMRCVTTGPVGKGL
jgi:hypothetical protein